MLIQKLTQLVCNLIGKSLSMQLVQDSAENAYIIQSYQPGTIVINDTAYHHSLIIGSNFFEPNWPVKNISDITTDNLIFFIQQQPELIIIGTGEITQSLPTSLQHLCYQKKIGIECMNTAAACRTLTILFAEKRHVIAGLII